MGLLFGFSHFSIKSSALLYGGAGSFASAHWAFSFKPVGFSPSFFSLSSFRFGANNLFCYRPPIAAANVAPVTSPVTLASIFEDRPFYIITQAQLLARASDANGDFLRASNLSIAQGNGSLINNGNGTWTYIPAANDDTAVRFIYQVSDGKVSTIGRANLDLVAVNDAPTSSLVTMPAIIEDSGSYVITSAQLLAQATDAENQVLQVLNLTISSGQGSLVDNGNGNWTFTPAANYSGAVQLGYQISDGNSSTSGSAYIDVTNVNDAPITSGPVTLASVAENTSSVLITQNDLLANASDVDSNLQAINLSIASGQGSLTNNNDGTWTYTPAINDDTNVSFNFQVTDGQFVVSSSANLDLTPSNSIPTNSGPINLVVLEDNSILITQNSLLTNASDADGDPLQAINLTINSGAGNLIDNGNGTWTFIPSANDDTQVVFGYSIIDGNGGSVAGTVNLDLFPVNDSPVSPSVNLTQIAEDSAVRVITQAELLANASDVDGNPLLALNLTIASGNGSLLDNGNGTWNYTPAANDNSQVIFNYTIVDSLGATIAVNASLEITPVNDIPTTSPVILAPTLEDSGSRIITQAELLANAADIDGDPLTVSNLAITAGLGNLVDNGNGQGNRINPRKILG